MTHWLAVTTQENWKICQETKTWGTGDLYEAAMKSVDVGDRLLVYVRGMKCAGIFRIARPYFNSDEVLWADELYPHRIEFEDDVVPQEPIGVTRFFYSFFPTVAPSGYFRRGFRKLPEDQFELFEDFLTKFPIEIETISPAEEPFTLSLEKDLEGYLESNLESLEEGLSLAEQGRQFSTDVTRIDLLATDKDGNFVVVELKAGEADRQAVGQILPYMGWVREHLAQGQPVRGILVASRFSPEVEAAINIVQNLALYRYEVSFSFEAIGPRLPISR